MPTVRIEWLAGRPAALKQTLAAEMTALMVSRCGCDPAHVYVIFDDVQPGDWAVAGRLFSEPGPAEPVTGRANGPTTAPTASLAAPSATVGARS